MSVGNIDFNKTFGNKDNAGTKTDQPKAQLWLNVGYVAAGAGKDDEGNPEDRFVSLPIGIPVDTQEPLSTNVRNDSFRALQSARNDLLEQIMAVGEGLNPGGEVILNLQIQLRRVNGEQEAVSNEENQFIRKLDLVAKPTAPEPKAK